MLLASRYSSIRGGPSGCFVLRVEHSSNLNALFTLSEMMAQNFILGGWLQCRRISGEISSRFVLGCGLASSAAFVRVMAFCW